MVEFVFRPWHLVILLLASSLNREPHHVIEYLQSESEVLREKLGKGRILLNDEQRRRLAVKGKAPGRKALTEIATIVTLDTILRWHRQLVAKKWDYSSCKTKVGRPPVPDELVTLVVRMAEENPGWGYDRIQGSLENLGHTVSDRTVGNILKSHGIEPAPKRSVHTSWKTFINAHWEVFGAVDFTTVEV